jgi:hypothetical protein
VSRRRVHRFLATALPAGEDVVRHVAVSMFAVRPMDKLDRLSALRRWRTVGPVPRVPGRCALTAPQGGPLREQKFVAGVLKPAAARAGPPHRLRFHDLRQTCASLLIARGASVKFEKAEEQVSDLLPVVEVGRLELPSRGVVPGFLRAQPPVEVQTRVVRWRRSRVLAS